MKNPDGTTHPATFQADLCEQLTPATVIVWIQRQATRMHGERNDTAWRALVVAAGVVERYLLPVEGGTQP